MPDRSIFRPAFLHSGYWLLATGYSSPYYTLGFVSLEFPGFPHRQAYVLDVFIRTNISPTIARIGSSIPSRGECGIESLHAKLAKTRTVRCTISQSHARIPPG